MLIFSYLAVGKPLETFITLTYKSYGGFRR
jgi:hypothetical protein